MGRPKIISKEILKEILTDQEYNLFFSLYLSQRRDNRDEMKQKMGIVQFNFIFHNALRKIFQDETAKLYVLNDISQRRFDELQKEYHKIPKSIGALDDKYNPYVSKFLSKFSGKMQMIAQKYLGIGTGTFLLKYEMLQMLRCYGSPTDAEVFDTMVRQILEEIFKQNYTEDYLALLTKCPNPQLKEAILNIFSEIYQQQKLKQRQKVKEDEEIDRDELEKIREKARLTANLKRGYLFGDTFLNVADLSEDKELTIKNMTHHEGLLQMSKKSLRIGGMQVFLAIAIFINFVNDEKFSLLEIASITGLPAEELNNILHEKIKDFIALLPEELKISHAQKLCLYY